MNSIRRGSVTPPSRTNLEFGSANFDRPLSEVHLPNPSAASTPSGNLVPKGSGTDRFDRVDNANRLESRSTWTPATVPDLHVAGSEPPSNSTARSVQLGRAGSFRSDVWMRQWEEGRGGVGELVGGVHS